MQLGSVIHLLEDVKVYDPSQHLPLFNNVRQEEENINAIKIA